MRGSRCYCGAHEPLLRHQGCGWLIARKQQQQSEGAPAAALHEQSGPLHNAWPLFASTCAESAELSQHQIHDKQQQHRRIATRHRARLFPTNICGSKCNKARTEPSATARGPPARCGPDAVIAADQQQHHADGKSRRLAGCAVRSAGNLCAAAQPVAPYTSLPIGPQRSRLGWTRQRDHGAAHNHARQGLGAYCTVLHQGAGRMEQVKRLADCGCGDGGYEGSGICAWAAGVQVCHQCSGPGRAGGGGGAVSCITFVLCCCLVE